MMGIVRFFVPTINNRKMYSARHVHILHPHNIFVRASMIHMGRPLFDLQPHWKEEDRENPIKDFQRADLSSISLAESLASLQVEPSTNPHGRYDTRMGLKRLIEIRIKKRVKDQYLNGKYHNLLEKVVANPKTLKDAYDSIRLSSNVNVSSNYDDICFASIAEQLVHGEFVVRANTFFFSTRSALRETLALPNLKLKVIQEAIRVVLEVVYRPYFSKFSHGCRSGRGYKSAINYLCKEIKNPGWYFTLNVKKKVDLGVMTKLISLMQEKINDESLYSLLVQMHEAQVLNFEFGGFPKGHGLPQEGVLSPILMNIYLDSFDRALYEIIMEYEGLHANYNDCQGINKYPSLRTWFRSQINENCEKLEKKLKILACRYMDEILIVILGSRDYAHGLRARTKSFLTSKLYLSVDGRTDIQALDCERGIQFLGIIIKTRIEESCGLRAVHKLKEKVSLFALQKQEAWEAGTIRIGKKWLAHGLKKIKESEIKHLVDPHSVLHEISHLRKTGMKTDHWFKFLLKIWMQDVDAKAEDNEEKLLAKHIVEPALHQDLKESFYNFQKAALEYISAESDSTLALLNESKSGASLNFEDPKVIAKTFAPLSGIIKFLSFYNIINSRGFPQRVSTLIFHDNIEIVNWFAGLTRRWLKWYSGCANFDDIKHLIVQCLRMACIRTLASKHRIHESTIEKKFEADLDLIPSVEEIDSDMVTIKSALKVNDEDEALMYEISNSGLCMLHLTRLVDPSEHCICCVIGCQSHARGVYTLVGKERQRFPEWRSGFVAAVHPSLNRRRLALCKEHVEDLFMGQISLFSIDFEVSSCSND